MSSAAIKKFKVTYTNDSGEQVTEEPRLMLSVDGKHKSLFLGDGPIATVPIDAPDNDLWTTARSNIGNIPTYVK